MNGTISKPKSILLGAVAGLLLASAFPPMPFFFLAFVAFIPLLKAIDEGTAKPFLLYYVTFFVYHGASNWWISSFQEKTDPFLMASGFAIWLVHPFFFMLPLYSYGFLKRKVSERAALYSFPLLWVLFEWGHSLSQFSYPWLTVGYTQVNNSYWIQFIDLTGIWGASLLLCYINVIIYDMMRRIGSAVEGKARLSRFKKELSFLALLIVLPLIYGFISFGRYGSTRKHEKINVVLVQPDIDPWEKWQTMPPLEMIRMQMQLADSAASRFRDKADIVVFPETALPALGMDFNRDHNFGFLYEWVRLQKASLLTGFIDYYFYPDKSRAVFPYKMTEDRQAYDTYNSALLMNPGSDKDYDIYHKMKLTPFAERIPHIENYAFLQKYLSWGVGISSWGIGKDQHNLQLRANGKTAELAPVICIESIYPDFVRKFAHKGAEMMVIITNDAWYDHTPGPAQHWHIARARAIENRRYIVRSANSGVTGVISATGEEKLRAEQYKSLATVAAVPLLKEKSFYTLYGDWIIIPVSLLLSAIIIFFRKKVQI